MSGESLGSAPADVPKEVIVTGEGAIVGYGGPNDGVEYVSPDGEAYTFNHPDEAEIIRENRAWYRAQGERPPEYYL